MRQQRHELPGAAPEDAWQNLAALLYVAVAAGYPVRDVLALLVVAATLAAVRRRLT